MIVRELKRLIQELPDNAQVVIHNRNLGITFQTSGQNHGFYDPRTDEDFGTSLTIFIGDVIPLEIEEAVKLDRR